MLSILLSLLVLSPIVWAEETDEFSFIKEGEKNRAINEAERAPSASHFLEDEDEDEGTEMWSTTPSADGAPVEDVEDVEALGFVSSNHGYESSDPEEDIAGLGPDLQGREPLGDHYPLNITRSELGTLVAELPVLVARNQDDLSGDLWVVADIYSDGLKITESRHFISPRSVNDLGPTYVWIKASIPAQAPTGQVEVRVFAAPPGKKEVQIFSRRAPYRL